MLFPASQVNVGDEMEIFTNGLYPATRHRVVVPPEETVRRTHRQSLAFFVHVDDAITLRPIGDDQVPASDRYRPVKCASHLDALFKATYRSE